MNNPIPPPTLASSSYAGRQVLVTGASGFIGTNLCRRLQAAGAQVHGISRREHANQPDITWWQGDVADVAALRRIWQVVAPEYVFHLASHVAGSRSLDLVLPIFHSNLASTVNLLTLAAEFGCTRFVQMGSLEEPERGEVEPTPCSAYAAAKWASSAYLRMFHDLYGVPVVNTRVFMVYGAGQTDLRKLIPYVTLALLQGQVPQLMSGAREVDWIYVDDVVDGLLLAGSVIGAEGATVELGSGRLVTVRALIDQLVQLMQPAVLPQWGSVPDRPLERVRVADTSIAYKWLGWQPRTSLRQGLQQTIDWYAQQLMDTSAEADVLVSS